MSGVCPAGMEGRVQGFPNISAVLSDSARNNNPPDICSCEALESKSSGDQKSVMKSEVSQLPQRRGLIQGPILSADVNRVRYGPGNVGMPEQVMSPCALVRGGGCVGCSSLYKSAAPVSGLYIWGLLSRCSQNL